MLVIYLTIGSESRVAGMVVIDRPFALKLFVLLRGSILRRILPLLGVNTALAPGSRAAGADQLWPDLMANNQLKRNEKCTNILTAASACRF
jgi:hypothetical protein